MNLLQLQEAGYANAKTLERVMHYVDEDAKVKDGFMMQIKTPQDNHAQPIYALSVQHDEDDGTPYMLVSYFNRETEVYDPEEFVEMVEVYDTKRIL